MLELACPETCRYLRDAREQSMVRDGRLRTRALFSEGAVARGKIDPRLLEAIYVIEGAIVKVHRNRRATEFGNLTDQDVLTAIENAIRNLEIEQSGIIYEQTAQSPRIQEISRRVLESLESWQGRGEDAERLSPALKIQALNASRATIRAFMQRAESEPAARSSYLRHAALFAPWPDADQSSLVI